MHAALAAVNAAEQGTLPDALACAYANAGLCAALTGLPRASRVYINRARYILDLATHEVGWCRLTLSNPR
jgi:hypothetical protein